MAFATVNNHILVADSLQLPATCFILYFGVNYIIGIGSFSNVGKGTCY